MITAQVCGVESFQSDAQPRFGNMRPNIPVSEFNKLSHSDGIMFQGTSKGKATSASVMPTQILRFGMQSAIAMPRGIWMVRTNAENSVLRPKLAQKRYDPIISAYHSVPTQKRAFRMKISKKE